MKLSFLIKFRYIYSNYHPQEITVSATNIYSALLELTKHLISTSPSPEDDLGKIYNKFSHSSYHEDNNTKLLISALDYCSVDIISIECTDRKFLEFMESIQDSVCLEPYYTINHSWIIGGRTGGSCWDNCDSDANYVSVYPEIKPTFTEFENIINQKFPNLSYQDFKKIEKLMQYSQTTTNEYYGNYTDYMVESLSLIDLYQYMYSSESNNDENK